MSDGKRLKEILDNRGLTTREVAKKANISPQTLYSIIQRDGDIRFDYAIKIAAILDIDVNEICSHSPFKEVDIEEFFDIPDNVNEMLESDHIKKYMVENFAPLIEMFGVDNIAMVDQFLRGYYSISDEGRAQVTRYMQFVAQTETDEDRKNQIRKCRKERHLDA